MFVEHCRHLEKSGIRVIVKKNLTTDVEKHSCHLTKAKCPQIPVFIKKCQSDDLYTHYLFLHTKLFPLIKENIIYLKTGKFVLRLKTVCHSLL